MESAFKRIKDLPFLKKSDGLEHESLMNADEKDTYYFATYEKIQVHEDMLKDESRMKAYYNAILSNKALFEGATVIDVGSGTGVLSMFCVLAGAKKVYAVECSEMASLSEQIIASNNMADKIQVIKQKAEDIELEEKVDIIVSEWMGYCLMYEWMLDSVICVRDKFLKKGGRMFPCEANLYVALLTNPEFVESRIDFWKKSQAGLDMSCLLGFAKVCNFFEPTVEFVEVEQIMSFSKCILHLNLECCTRFKNT